MCYKNTMSRESTKRCRGIKNENGFIKNMMQKNSTLFLPKFFRWKLIGIREGNIGSYFLFQLLL
jgi:hypothetical protein